VARVKAIRIQAANELLGGRSSLSCFENQHYGFANRQHHICLYMVMPGKIQQCKNLLQKEKARLKNLA